MFAAGGPDQNPKPNHSKTMNAYNPEPDDDAGYFFDEEKGFDALSAIYRDAGLSDENARKSAAADYEHLFGGLASCAA